jgi:O-antigen/teichoic acid export membrane protein
LEQEQSSYRQIFKTTSLLGSVQVFNILIGIIRSKFIAVLLGTTGMGIAGLLTSTTSLITWLTNFGLGSSAVRDVAEAHAQQNKQRVSIVVTTLRRLVWFTGLLGTFVTLILAPWLSELTFGNKDYTYPFMFLSITLLFSQLCAGQDVLLQGTRNLRYLAKASLLGSVLGLLVTVPLYYFLGINGIVPALVIASGITLTLSWYFSRKVSIDKIQLSFKEIRREGKSMLIMGFMINLSGIISTALSYVIRIYIVKESNEDQVGLYNAGLTLVGNYVGLVFTAMGASYYPQLTAFASKFKEFNNLINQQIELGLLILSPLIVAFIIFIKVIIFTLYSSDFFSIEGLVYWAIFAVFFRVIGWSIGYAFLAKGDFKSYFFNELVAICYHFVLNIIFYHYLGLTGLGISYLVNFLLYFFQVWIFGSKKYQIRLHGPILRIFIPQFFLACGSMALVLFAPINIRYIAGVIVFAVSCFYSYKELDKRIEMNKWIRNKLHK